jgi:hypothetical protein
MRPEPRDALLLFCLAVRLVFPAVRAKLLHFKALRGRPLVFGFAVIPVFALAALELNDLAWHGCWFLSLVRSLALPVSVSRI